MTSDDTIDAGTYILVSLADMERLTRNDEVQAGYYVDIEGADAAQVAEKIVPQSGTSTETLPSGSVRFKLTQHPYLTGYAQIVAAGEGWAKLNDLDARFFRGSSLWVGSHFRGYEAEGTKVCPDPQSGARVRMLHFPKNATITSKMGDGGLSSLQIASAAPPKAEPEGDTDEGSETGEKKTRKYTKSSKSSK